MEVTIKELADATGFNQPVTTGFVRMATELGLIEVVGDSPVKPARGRTPKVYSLTGELEKRVRELSSKEITRTHKPSESTETNES